VDRFAKVVPGRNFLWDGSDASMTNFAIYNWAPSTGPVNIAFIQAATFGGSQFPTSKFDHAFVTESGPTWGTGPQSNGKRITEYVLDAAGNLVSGPLPFVEYIGAGKATAVALAAGPDGLYFSDLYRDQDYSSPIDRGANILRVRFVGAADFTADITTGPAPLGVQFTDLSTGPAPAAWLWDFGDSTTSTAQHPTHTYADDGVYAVQLSVTTANGLLTLRRPGYIRVGDVPRIALIGGGNPPTISDQAVADHLSASGYDVLVYDDEPANRPSAATLAAANDLVVVSSSIASGNVAGEFRTADVPLIFWEQALLRVGREALADNGLVIGGATTVTITSTAHPITDGVAPGALDVFSPPANMSLGVGAIAPAAQVLATAPGAPGQPAILTAEAGAPLLGGYTAPARRVFLFFEDASFLDATPAAEQLLDRAVCWALGAGPPGIVQPPQPQLIIAGQPLTLTVVASGLGPRSYQWRRDAVPIGGATGATYSVAAAAPGDSGDYDVTVANNCGQTTSPAATIRIRARGDLNCDGAIDFFDIDPFLLALFDPAGYALAHPACTAALADLNADNLVNFFDIDPFLVCLFSGCP
jgi:PKD repeat protein